MLPARETVECHTSKMCFGAKNLCSCPSSSSKLLYYLCPVCCASIFHSLKWGWELYWHYRRANKMKCCNSFNLVMKYLAHKSNLYYLSTLIINKCVEVSLREENIIKSYFMSWKVNYLCYFYQHNFNCLLWIRKKDSTSSHFTIGEMYGCEQSRLNRI